MSNAAPKTKVIGGILYEVTPLDAFEGLDLFEYTLKLLSPSAAGVADSAAVATALDQLATLGAGNALRAIGRSLEGRTLTTMYAAKFAPLTCYGDADAGVEGRRPRLNETSVREHFRGRIANMLEWLAFCMEVNYGDFFAESGPLGSLVARLKLFQERLEAMGKKDESPDPSQEESAGESGE